jgi:hypothetical protein
MEPFDVRVARAHADTKADHSCFWNNYIFTKVMLSLPFPDHKLLQLTTSFEQRRLIVVANLDVCAWLSLSKGPLKALTVPHAPCILS